jgi:hypothetical protein
MSTRCSCRSDTGQESTPFGVTCRSSARPADCRCCSRQSHERLAGVRGVGQVGTEFTSSWSSDSDNCHRPASTSQCAEQPSAWVPRRGDGGDIAEQQRHCTTPWLPSETLLAAGPVSTNVLLLHDVPRAHIRGSDHQRVTSARAGHDRRHTRAFLGRRHIKIDNPRDVPARRRFAALGIVVLGVGNWLLRSRLIGPPMNSPLACGCVHSRRGVHRQFCRHQLSRPRASRCSPQLRHRDLEHASRALSDLRRRQRGPCAAGIAGHDDGPSQLPLVELQATGRQTDARVATSSS